MTSKVKLKVSVIGCVDFSFHVLECLLDNHNCEVVSVITKKESSINSDFKDLSPLAIAHDIPFIYVSGNDQPMMEEHLKVVKPDVVFCVGWSYLLRPTLLRIPRGGVIGYHPAKLPENRGRHPLIWALALGLKETGSTFFLMDEGADSGAILSQHPLPIKETDYAEDLYKTMLNVSHNQIELMLQDWSQTISSAKVQSSEGNLWRKRSKEDGRIDWRMSSVSVYNLIRALSRPYPGAHFVYQDKEYIVWQGDLVCVNDANSEPGKVLQVDEYGITVKCGVGVIRLTQLSEKPELVVGSYL